MCLIIAPGKDGKKALLPRDVFDYVYGKNDDGFGAMWVEDGKVNHFKTLGLSADEIYSTMEEFTERHPSVVFHMRYRTHGKVTPGLCHPFRVLHRSRHGKDLFFMHNGILSAFGNELKPGQSDTTNFKDKILIPLLTRRPDALQDKETLDSINKLTTGSRLLSMDSDGNVVRTSESSWNERYGLMLSNTYMLPSEVQNRYTGNYSAGAGGYSGGAGTMGGVTYNSYRTIKYSDGREAGTWCSIPKAGFIMTEGGSLYIDQGHSTPIEHAKWFIPKESHEVALAQYERTPGAALASAKTLLTIVGGTDDAPFQDDDLPFDPRVPDEEDDEVAEDEDTYTVAAGHATTVGEAVATQDVKLRYARIMHNCHHGVVANRAQLMADIMCTGREELADLVKEDPETAHTMLSELFEIFIEQNDILYNDEETMVYAFPPDDMLSHGELSHHRESMASITESRRKNYEKMVKDRTDAAFKKVYPEDTGSAVMETEAA